jgi:hypothetical protein
VKPALAILAAAVLLLAGCGSNGSHPAATTQPSLGALRLIKATGKTMRFAGGPTQHFESAYFLLKPRAAVTYLWSCTGFGPRSSFSATLQDADASSSDQMADTTRGDAPLGNGGFANLDSTDGRITTQAYNVLVTASRCRWSLTVLFGSPALARYVNGDLSFSLDFDPTSGYLFPVRRLSVSEARALGGTRGVLVGLISATSKTGRAVLSVRAVTGASAAAVRPTQVEALVPNGPVHVSRPQRTSLDGLPGYRIRMWTNGPQRWSSYIYLIASGSFRYEVAEAWTSGAPVYERTLRGLLKSFTFLGRR